MTPASTVAITRRATKAITNGVMLLLAFSSASVFPSAAIQGFAKAP
jgi:hypothetical protein